MDERVTITEFLLARIAEDPRLDAEWREALRQIVTFADPTGAPDGEGVFVADKVLRLLALPYASHPDYRQEVTAAIRDAASEALYPYVAPEQRDTNGLAALAREQATRAADAVLAAIYPIIRAEGTDRG